jgi:acetyl esterase/lipase
MLIPSYTLATVRPFPAALEDTVSAQVWATENQVKLSWSGKRLVVAGIEAGANLAAASALACRDRKGPHICGQILLMPMLDPTFASRSMRESTATAEKFFAAHRSATGFQSYLPNLADRTHPYATPL